MHYIGVFFLGVFKNNIGLYQKCPKFAKHFKSLAKGCTDEGCGPLRKRKKSEPAMHPLGGSSQ